MRGRTSPLIASLVVGAALAVSLAGCVENYGAFYISQALVADTDCLPPAPGGGGLGLASGLLDVSGRTGYLLFIQIENHMQSSVGTTGVELNNLSIREFRVKLDLGNIPLPNLPENLVKFSQKAAGTIGPTGGKYVTSMSPIGDELASLLADVIPAATKPTVVAEVRAFGVRAGSEMETPAFPFPIKLCSGCLIDLRSTCPAETEEFFSNVCGLPQDAPVTCCKKSGWLNCMMSTTGK